MPTKTEAIKAFLSDFTVPDLAALYSYNMEVQVNVSQDDGEPVSGEGFMGRLWRGYSNGIQTWKPFRIPWNASSKPEYNDSNLTWSLLDHAEGIGMTGWDWKNKVSKWVAFDFDDIIGHNTGLTANELAKIQDEANKIPWITIRRSTGGNGLHFYVFLDDVPTENHNEHSALARAIIGKMTALTGYDFQSKVDICGGNMWVWHRKMRGTEGLKLIKAGSILTDIPINWKDHIPVIVGRRRRTLPSFIKDESTFKSITSNTPKLILDEEHRKLIDHLEENECQSWYDQDNGILVCHTYDLKEAHEALGFRGIFETVASGKHYHSDHNAFMRPIPQGSWIVRRFTKGIQEHPSWYQDSSGWTTCYYNKEPSLASAARAFNGVEDEKGNFHFNEAEVAQYTARALGTNIDIPIHMCARKTILKSHKDQKRLIVEIQRETSDDPSKMQGWREEKGFWKRIYNANVSSPESNTPEQFDAAVRHLIDSNGSDLGWCIKTDTTWNQEPLHHVKIALKSMGLYETEIEKLLGKCVIEPWKLVHKPFEDEYPGNREWNRNSVQLRVLPQQDAPFFHPTWDKLLDHIGQGLTSAIINDPWCKVNSILTGSDYLRLWVASLFQFPLKHLPYLFLYSPEQQSGKTSFHEALKLLITSNGYIDAKAALINPQGFNEELANAVVCAIDECDLRQNKYSYERIKNWVTEEDMLIHPKGKTPYLIKNTAHFIQTANDPNACPVFTGDKRVIVIRVPPLNIIDLIPKDTFRLSLEKESSAFLGTLFKIEIPPCRDRLSIPVIETDEKDNSSKLTMNALEVFIQECCYFVPGATVRYSDFWKKFQDFLDPSEVHTWSKIRMGRSLPSNHPKGRMTNDSGQYHIGNISFTKNENINGKKLIARKDYLEFES